MDTDLFQLELNRLTSLIADYNDSLYEAVRLRDKYKTALERILKSTSGTFREMAREALNE